MTVILSIIIIIIISMTMTMTMTIIIIIIIIIIAEMAVFDVAGYLVEERPVLTACPRGQYSK